jgi:hypothetical protein
LAVKRPRSQKLPSAGISQAVPLRKDQQALVEQLADLFGKTVAVFRGWGLLREPEVELYQRAVEILANVQANARCCAQDKPVVVDGWATIPSREWQEYQADRNLLDKIVLKLVRAGLRDDLIITPWLTNASSLSQRTLLRRARLKREMRTPSRILDPPRTKRRGQEAARAAEKHLIREIERLEKKGISGRSIHRTLVTAGLEKRSWKGFHGWATRRGLLRRREKPHPSGAAVPSQRELSPVAAQMWAHRVPIGHRRKKLGTLSGHVLT